MPEIHLRKSGFKQNACRPFAKKIKERMQKFTETGDSKYNYQKELDKTCFQHNTAF